MQTLLHIWQLWKDRKEYKGTTLQGRLILCFSLLICSILLLFTILLMVFGINGSGQQTVSKYLDSELNNISDEIQKDIGNLAATGIQMAQAFTTSGDTFFSEHLLSANQLQEHPDMLELLMEELMPTLVSSVEYSTCGGAFIIVDATVSQDGDDKNKRTGFYLKKTQPVYSVSLDAQNYCLRGSALLARENDIQLLGQWNMEFDESELEFFHTVMNTVKDNSDLPLSRLYFFSDRIQLKDNIETGLLICVPLLSSDGTCWGVCGIEISDRMFKQLYCPNEGEYQGIFVTLSPRSDDILFTDRGLIAGNRYLTGNQMTGSLSYTGKEKDFSFFTSNEEKYGGVFQNISLYASGSPYEDQEWTIALLMPKSILESQVRGKIHYLFYILLFLLVLSLTIAIFVSKRYLEPIRKGLSSIREKDFDSGMADFGIKEIDDLFDNLAKDMREYQEELERLSLEKQNAEAQIEEAQSKINKAYTRIDRLTDKRKQDIDPEEYEMFLENLSKLTSTEQKLFELYLEGKSTEEILAIQNIKENTLKYHNRNIFGKLGVTSRKQLLQFATIMQTENE